MKRVEVKYLSRQFFKRWQPKPQRSIRFYKYFFSYVVIVVVLLLLIGVVIYGNFMKQLQGEVENSNTIALSQIRYAVDLRLEELSHIALQIASNPRLTPYMVSSGGYDSYEAVQELQKYRDSNSFIQDIIVYYGGKYADRMYSANTSFSPEQFFEHYYKYDDWDLERFRQAYAALSEPHMRPVETVQINGIRSARLATYLYPLPSYAKPYGVILFQINETSFGGIVQNALQNYRGDLYIFDADKQLVYSLTSGETGMDHDLSAFDPDSLTQTVSTMSIGGDSLSLIRLASKESGWTYMIVLPTKHLMLKVLHSRNVFNYTAVALLLLGLAMSFGLAANNYGPLRKLATELKKQVQGDAEPKDTDEIAYLSRAIGEVANERRGLMARLDSRTGLMKEQVLLTLLKGKTESPEQLRQLFDLSAVKLDRPYFAVMLLSIDDYRTFQQANSPSMRDLYVFCIINVVEELAKEIGSGYAVDLIDNIGIALTLNLDAEHREERFIRELTEKARNFFRETYKMTLTIGVGTTCEGLSRIRQSYLEALRASYYRLIRGNDQTIFYTEVETEPETEYRYPAEQEEQLVMAIRQGKSDEAAGIIHAVTDDIIRQSLTPDAARMVCFGIIHTIMRTLDEMDLGRGELSAGDILSLLPRRFESVDILEARIAEYCRQVCDYISDNKESKNFALRDSILAYVEANYREPSLDLRGIAGQFQLSPSYLTRLMKDQTGTSLIRYVDALRMEEAKQLLRGTDLPTKHIVTQVGYVDESNFLRKFKKKEGVTPMQFRQMMKGKS